jgi:hypothetical protein
VCPQGETARERSWWPPRSSILHVYITFCVPRAQREDPRRGPPHPHLSPSPTLYYWSTGRLQTSHGRGPYCPRRTQPQRDVAGTKQRPLFSAIKPMGRPGPHRLAPPLKGVGGYPYAGPHGARENVDSRSGRLPRWPQVPRPIT